MTRPSYCSAIWRTRWPTSKRADRPSDPIGAQAGQPPWRGADRPQRISQETHTIYRTKSGEDIFIIDGHVHLWDGSKANLKNVHGQQFIDCFYAYHSNLSPKEYLWPKEKFDNYGPEVMYDDLFVKGYDDMAICQPTYLTDFYKNGFNTTEKNYEMKKKHPNRFIVNGAFDPRDGEAGLDYLDELSETYGIKGVKLYTAEWRGDSKGYKLSDPGAQKYLERSAKLGIKNIHVHKGPTILPLNLDAFDVADIDDAATNFQNLNFIVEHCGLPRLDDFWVELGCFGCCRYRGRGDQLSESELYRRALWPAASGRFLLDRHPGDERLRWPGGRAAVHSLASGILRACDLGVGVLDRRGQDTLRQRLRHLVAQVVDREIHGLRIAGIRQQGNRRATVADGEEKNPRAQRGTVVRHRCRGAEEVAGRCSESGCGRGMKTPMTTANATAAVDRPSTRIAEVWDRLASVTDPELDES